MTDNNDEGLPSKTGQELLHSMDYMFDYSEVTEDDEDVIKEIIRLAREQGNDDFADELGVKFGLVELPEYDASNSSFIKALEDANYAWNTQGYSTEGGVRYPVMGVMGEIRQLNTITDTLIAKIVALCEEENNKTDD